MKFRSKPNEGNRFPFEESKELEQLSRASHAVRAVTTFTSRLVFLAVISFWSLPLFAEDTVGSATGNAGGQANDGGGSIFIMFGMLAIVVYFMMIRPQRKQMKEHENLLNSLKKDDEVRTSSGIFGKIVSVDLQSNNVVLKIDDSNNVKMKIMRSAIVEVLNQKNTNQEAASS